MASRDADIPPGVDPRGDPYDELGADPRPRPSAEAAPVDSNGDLRPTVAGGGTGASLWLIGGGATLFGIVAFLWLSSHRSHGAHDVAALTTPSTTATAALPAPSEPPPGVDAMEAASRGVPPASPPVTLPVAAPPPPVVVAQVKPVTPATIETPQGKTPVLVVDLAPAVEAASIGAAPPGSAAAKPADPAHPGAGGLNGDEQFAARVEASQPDRSRATVLRNQGTTAPQGTVIPAVLETALNSDLPGFTRAVVSRDVRSFNGSQVLIPRGSRVIGEYRSAAALGQSRVFVIWTRVLRPDGVSIQIGSAGGDSLGRAGLAGTVDRHFFERFGGAILLSVVNAGVTTLAGNPSTQVVIGSSSDASGIASQASAFAPTNISPTIKVPQGTPIRIFVARDLDFSPVQDGGG